MNPEKLANIIAEILTEIFSTTDNPTVVETKDIVVVRPKSRDHGDWATGAAMKYAKVLSLKPAELAEKIIQKLTQSSEVKHAEVAGPGFINISLGAGASAQVVLEVLDKKEKYGTSNILDNAVINLEFVSANPTGPLHIGHTRWAALGDSMSRVLRASGAKVTNEFYINDAGNQMEKFGRSVLAAALGEEAPEDGYPGEYIKDLGAKLISEHPELAGKDKAVALDDAAEYGYVQQLAEIKQSLSNFRVNFDVFFSERQLHEIKANTKSSIEEMIDVLHESGHTYEKDGAIWVQTTKFGDDKDRVVKRSNGVYTYFAADAAYYLSKKQRGFIKKIYLLGADHHGYVNRLKAIAAALGDDPEKNIEIQIGQLVNLNGAKLSKRAGNIIELDDLLEWLGTDALRFWLARYPADSPLNLDGEALRKRSNDNPVYYVQYAHARTCQVARNAAESGVKDDAFNAETLTHETENDLLASLQEYPRVLETAAKLFEPHRIARYLEELAGHYHRWYSSCRVIPLGEEVPNSTHSSRLKLNNATRVVLANALELLGVSAPEKM